jgi:hypothetical protein
MLTKIVEYQDGDKTYRLVITEATALVAMKRTLLRGTGMVFVERYRQAQTGLVPVSTAGGAGDQEEGEPQAEESTEVAGQKTEERPTDPVTMSAVAILAQVVYPDLISATIEASGLNVGTLSIDDFIALDERLVGAWETAVYDLNPHWLAGPGPAEDEGAQKKA